MELWYDNPFRQIKGFYTYAFEGANVVKNTSCRGHKTSDAPSGAFFYRTPETDKSKRRR